jgi:heme/copper-type cytochrome/quinol oxidase subunit 2
VACRVELVGVLGVVLQRGDLGHVRLELEHTAAARRQAVHLRKSGGINIIIIMVMVVVVVEAMMIVSLIRIILSRAGWGPGGGTAARRSWPRAAGT